MIFRLRRRSGSVAGRATAAYLGSLMTWHCQRHCKLVLAFLMIIGRSMKITNVATQDRMDRDSSHSRHCPMLDLGWRRDHSARLLPVVFAVHGAPGHADGDCDRPSTKEAHRTARGFRLGLANWRPLVPVYPGDGRLVSAQAWFQRRGCQY